MIKLIPKLNVFKSNSFEKKKMDIIRLMPNQYQKNQAMAMFQRLNTKYVLESNKE